MAALNRFIERRFNDTGFSEIIRSRTSNSVSVTGYDVLTHSAVNACVSLIADSISTLPRDVYEKRRGVRVEIDSPEVIVSPSDWISDVDWRRQRLISWLIYGNAYGLITKTDSRFRPLKVEMLDPACVVAREEKDGTISYRVDSKPVNPDLIVHWPGLLLPGSRIGVSQISYAKAQIGMGLNATKFASEYYTKGVKTNGILSVGGVRGTNEQADEIKRRFVHSAQDANEPVVLFGDTKYTPLNVPAADTQFLESANASGQDVCRFFGVPPEMIGLDSGSSMTYSNIESRSLHLSKFTLNPWIVREEKADLKLVTKPAYVKVNRDAALAIDTTTRYNAHATAIRAGIMSVNEIRSLEDLKPITGRDEPLWPPYAFGQVGQEEPLGK